MTANLCQILIVLNDKWQKDYEWNAGKGIGDHQKPVRIAGCPAKI
jgi:hypothetical protein